MSHLDYFYRLFPICITVGFVIPIRKSVGLLRNVKFSIPLGINTGMLCCIVKLPDEVCVSHRKRIYRRKQKVFQLKQFVEVLLSCLTLKKSFEKIFKNL